MTGITTTKLLFGGFFILLGFTVLIEQMFPQLNIDIFGILLGILLLGWGLNMYSRHQSRPLFSLFLIIIGGVILFENVVPWHVSVLWPVMIIFVGIVIIFGGNIKQSETSSSQTQSDKLNEFGLFASISRQVVSAKFLGGIATMLFGTMTLDLTKVQLEDDCTLEVNAIFGTVKVVTSKSSALEVKGTAVLGDFEDNTSTATTSGKKLTIIGAAVFGEVKVVSN